MTRRIVQHTILKLKSLLLIGLIFHAVFAVSAQQYGKPNSWADVLLAENNGCNRLAQFLLNDADDTEIEQFLTKELPRELTVNENVHFTSVLKAFLRYRIEQKQAKNFEQFVNENYPHISDVFWAKAALLCKANFEFETALHFLKLANQLSASAQRQNRYAEIASHIRTLLHFKKNQPICLISDWQNAIETKNWKVAVFSDTEDTLFAQSTHHVLRISKMLGHLYDIDTLLHNENLKRCSLVSVSGNLLYFSCKNTEHSDIYSLFIKGDSLVNLSLLPSPINSNANENGFSISKRNKKAYVSSDRAGGQGGYDLYAVDLPVKHSKAENLSQLNTPSDEQKPVVSTDESLLFFSNNENSTFGGFDLFAAEQHNGLGKKFNLGLPLNTIGNDIMLSGSLQGNLAVSLADYGKHTTYPIGIQLHANINYTLIRGTIIEKQENNRSFLGAKLTIIDKQDGQTVNSVYLPQKKQGRYYAVLHPGRFYDFIFTMTGYKPHVVSVYIPKQAYFYTLFQQIALSPLRNGSRRIGQQITVRNTFYDIYKVAAVAHPSAKLTPNTQKLSYVQDIVQNLMHENDSLEQEHLGANSYNPNLNAVCNGKNYTELLSQLEKAFAAGDLLSVKKMSEAAYKTDEYEHTFLFNDTAQINKPVEYKIDGKNIMVLAPLRTYSAMRREASNEELKKRRSFLGNSLLDLQGYATEENLLNKTEKLSITFEKNESRLCQENQYKLTSLSKRLIEKGERVLLFAPSGSNKSKIDKARTVAVKDFLLKHKLREEQILIYENKPHQSCKTCKKGSERKKHFKESIVVLILNPLSKTN